MRARHRHADLRQRRALQSGWHHVDRPLIVVLTDSQTTPIVTGALSGSGTGTLNLNAGIDGSTLFGLGPYAGRNPRADHRGGFTFGNFANVNLVASQAIAFAGAAHSAPGQQA